LKATTRTHIMPRVLTDHHKIPTVISAELSPNMARYTYLFPDLADQDSASTLSGKTPAQTFENLRQLIEALNLAPMTAAPMEGPPPVYTYFGQFLAHDISAPITRAREERLGGEPAGGMIDTTQDVVDLATADRPLNSGEVLGALFNQHEQPLTLASLYADGPSVAGSRELYVSGSAKFELAVTSHSTLAELSQATTLPHLIKHNVGAKDIPRDPALKIADRRNDENLILSQLHLAFMLFHNSVVDSLGVMDEGRKFLAARKLVTWHYQWLVVNDYLERLLAPGTVQFVLNANEHRLASRAVPMECIASAMRFGHSMVSNEYDFNENFGINSAAKAGMASLLHLFAFTSRGQMGGAASKQLPDHWVADWTRLTGTAAKSESIDARIPSHMIAQGNPQLGGIEHQSIVKLNVMRGFKRRLPFGQLIAKEFAINRLSAAQVIACMPVQAQDVVKALGFDTQTPSWLYFLCEAKAMADGKRLGPTASRIIAETVMGLLRHDRDSYLNAAWTPDKSPLKLSGGQPIDSIKHFLTFGGVMK
jgi:Animal haem peroxidase